jgi:hypothetical protein
MTNQFDIYTAEYARIRVTAAAAQLHRATFWASTESSRPSVV